MKTILALVAAVVLGGGMISSPAFSQTDNRLLPDQCGNGTGPCAPMSTPPPPTFPGSQRPPPARASLCQTPQGACRLAEPAPAQVDCWCDFGPGGVAPGLTQ